VKEEIISMKRKMGIGWSIGLAAIALCGLAFFALAQAADDESGKAVSDTAIDADVYKQFMATEVTDVYDLEQWFVDQQLDFLPIIPPAEDSVLRQPSGQVLPFAWEKFPTEFNKGLTLTYENGVPAYRVWIVEDKQTRQTLFFNEKGEQVFALAPAPGYDPLWFLKDYRPDLLSGHYTPWYVDYMARLYDPSRLQMEVTLIPSIYSEFYLYTETRVAEAAAALALSSGSDGGDGVMMSYSGPPVSNFCFAGIDLVTNFIRVTIAYPYNGTTYPTNCYTNRLDIFYSVDLLESWWELGTITNVSASTNWIEWTDQSVTDAWVIMRFYAAGNADIDSDGDGFADARERFMYHSDPNDANSHPVNVSGAVSYSGAETDAIHVLAVTTSNSWSLGCATAIPGPGTYTNGEVATLRSYWFKAFRDGTPTRTLSATLGNLGASTVHPQRT
jgi:hypothetical protein